MSTPTRGVLYHPEIPGGAR